MGLDNGWVFYDMWNDVIVVADWYSKGLLELADKKFFYVGKF